MNYIAELVETVRNAMLTNAIVDSLVEGAAELAVAGLSLIVAIGSALWSYHTARKMKEKESAMKVMESELQKQIDRANSLNERITHIQNSQFDFKFEICKELSEASFLMSHYFCVYIQCALLGGAEDKKRETEHMRNAELSCYKYRDMVFKYAPFIPQSIYKCADTLLTHGFAFIVTLGDNRKKGFQRDVSFINVEYQKVLDWRKKLADELREYLEKLARGEECA